LNVKSKLSIFKNMFHSNRVHIVLKMEYKTVIDYTACVLSLKSACGPCGPYKDLLSFSQINNDITAHCGAIKIRVPEITKAALIKNRIGIDYGPKHRFVLLLMVLRGNLRFYVNIPYT
jgi:hypothetical protein